MAAAAPIHVLSRSLREAASRAADLAGGGSALLFAALPADGEDAVPRLRSAAGFTSLEDARRAASDLQSAVTDCIEGARRQTAPGPAGMGPRAAAGVTLHPLEVAGRCHGALVVGTPGPTSSDAEEGLVALAVSTAMQIDHARLVRETAALEKRLMDSDGPASEAGDELLKLSEKIFEQDIELMRSSEKLGQIEKIKSDFIEKMSRELRTPLNGIIEAIVSVLAGENENLSDGARQSLRRALDEGTVYQRTLQNILDLWRIKQGELPVQIQELNIGEVIDEAIFSVQDTLADKPVEIEKQLPEPCPRIKGDLTKLNQVLFLLLDNAAKFTTQGRITISVAVADGWLRCSIEDTGIGICPDDQEYIFDEFFQVDHQASARYRGAGLGLSLARDLVGLLEGGCTIRSEAGHGTRATIEIPIHR